MLIARHDDNDDICIYIIINWHCFVISRLGSKPSWLYASGTFFRTATNKPSVSEGILTHMYHLQVATGNRNGEPIYCYPTTDYFVVSQLSNEGRHARCSKLVSEPDWLYASPICYRTTTSKFSVSEGILTHMYRFCFIYTYTLNGYLVLDSLEELFITWVATGNSSAREN